MCSWSCCLCRAWLWATTGAKACHFFSPPLSRQAVSPLPSRETLLCFSAPSSCLVRAVVTCALGKIGKAKDGKLAGRSYTVHKQAGQFFKWAFVRVEPDLTCDLVLPVWLRAGTSSLCTWALPFTIASPWGQNMSSEWVRFEYVTPQLVIQKLGYVRSVRSRHSLSGRSHIRVIIRHYQNFFTPFILLTQQLNKRRNLEWLLSKWTDHKLAFTNKSKNFLSRSQCK